MKIGLSALGLVMAGLAGVAIWYFGFERPKQDAMQQVGGPSACVPSPFGVPPGALACIPPATACGLTLSATEGRCCVNYKNKIMTVPKLQKSWDQSKIPPTSLAVMKSPNFSCGAGHFVAWADALAATGTSSKKGWVP